MWGQVIARALLHGVKMACNVSRAGDEPEAPDCLKRASGRILDAQAREPLERERMEEQHSRKMNSVQTATTRYISYIFISYFTLDDMKLGYYDSYDYE